MAKVLNLNRARKRKHREAEQAQAERNRAVHGRSKADKQLARAERDRAEREHAGHRLEGAGEGEIVAAAGDQDHAEERSGDRDGEAQRDED